MKNAFVIMTPAKAGAIFCRFLIGSVFLVYGLDGFNSFLPLPPPSAEGAHFLNALKESGYFYQFLKGLEILGGILMVGNFFVPLALLLLAPIIVNILLYGIFLDPQTLFVPLILVACFSHLVWYYRDLFRIFIKYQFYTSPDTEGKARVVIIDERARQRFNLSLSPAPDGKKM